MVNPSLIEILHRNNKIQSDLANIMFRYATASPVSPGCKTGMIQQLDAVREEVKKNEEQLCAIAEDDDSSTALLTPQELMVDIEALKSRISIFLRQLKPKEAQDHDDEDLEKDIPAPNLDVLA
ncbi:hypothetical protein MBLNU230_g5571t1 [Neophaeotheca triangularis]